MLDRRPSWRWPRRSPRACRHSCAAARRWPPASHRHQPGLERLGEQSSAAAARPSGGRQASSASTYQGERVGNGSRTPGTCAAATSTPPPAGARSWRHVGGCRRAGRAAPRRRRATAPRRRGSPLARAGEQPQRGRGNDAERALGAQEELLEVVAGIVLAQGAQPVQTRPSASTTSSPSTSSRAMP